MTRPSPPGERALALATAGRDVVQQGLATQPLGYAYHAKGDYRRAIDCFGQTVAALDGSGAPNALVTSSARCELRAFLAACHTELGTFIEGAAIGDEGLRIAEAVAHPGSLMAASWGSVC